MTEVIKETASGTTLEEAGLSNDAATDGKKQSFSDQQSSRRDVFPSDEGHSDIPSHYFSGVHVLLWQGQVDLHEKVQCIPVR